MNAVRKEYLAISGELQVAIVELMVAHPEITSREWASHLFLTGAAMSAVSGASRDEAAGVATDALNLAYSTQTTGRTTLN